MRIPDQEEKVSMRKLSMKSLLGCDNKQVKKSTQIAFALATGFLFTLMLTTVIMQAIILDIDLDDNDTASESNSNEIYNNGSEKCIVRGCHVFCLNLSLTRLIEISIKTAVKELKMCVNISLGLQFVNFDKNILPSYWLRDLNKPVASIQIIGGNLQHISADAFNSDAFTNLESIFINALAIIHLDEHSFAGIRNLHQLNIAQIKSLELTINTFQSFKTSLRNISIENCGVWDPRLISSPVLSNLEGAYFRFNDFKRKYLNQISLRGVKSTEILNLASSNIVSLENGTFDEFENLTYVNLNGNHLHSLPSHVFNSLLANNMNVTFDLHMNPWHCDCQLDFLRKLASNNYTVTMPTCFTPTRLTDLTFDSIKSFCADNTIEYYIGPYNYAIDPEQGLSTPTSCKIFTKIEVLNEINKYNTIISKNITDSSTEFSIVNEQQTSIRINFTGNLNGKYNLFWFPLSGALVPDTVACIPRVAGNVVLEDFQHGVYLFCLLDKNETVITSSHCKIHIHSTRGISLSWLTMSQKTTVLCIFGLSILSCLLLAACSVYLAVRNNSAILRASKRVIKVSNLRHRRTGEVYIMPTKLHKIIPTELKDTRRDRKSSKISTSSCKSGGTYVSTIEMNDSQSVSWRVRKASHNSQPKFTSVFAINKEEDKVDGRPMSLSDYRESGVVFRR